MDDEQREREIKGVLEHIQAIQKRSARKWRLDVTLPMLAGQAIVLFILGILVGIGLSIPVKIFFKQEAETAAASAVVQPAP